MAVARTAAEEALGLALPNRRVEEWKWTDLRRMMQTPYRAIAVKVVDAEVDKLIASAPTAKLKAQRAVFVNGVYDAKRSSVTGVKSHLPMVVQDDAVVSINSVLKASGISLKLEGNVDTPIELLHVVTKGEPRGIALRHSVDIVDGASATLIQTFVGAGDYLSSAVIDIQVGAGARLDRVKIEAESSAATHLAQANIVMSRNAILRDFTLSAGSALNRQNGMYTFAGEGADARVTGAYLLKGHQHADTRLVIDHAVPHCVSRELFQCVMDDHARGIFQGKVIVRPDAQKTDGKQSSHALLLSDTAEFDAKPELEIYADDVVCGHGATSGDLNHDHMFYLMSRGIPKAEARAMLIQAFVAEAIETVDNEAIRDVLLAFAAKKLKS
jgi:Fe-S cluster assembly protein SufD